MRKRVLSVLLAVMMLLACVPLGVMPVAAAYENTYANTGNQRTDIIGVALTQMGYKEGANNDTKYGDWYGLPNQPWCAMFISWCARQADIPTSILKNSAVAAPDYSYFNIPYRSGNSYTPQSGDLFFTESFSHVGLVYYVDGDYFYTIEGNSNNSGSSEGIGVFSLRRKISDYYFGMPEYTMSYTDIPDPVLTLRSNKTVYNSSESIRFEWEPAYGAEEYWVYLWKDGVQLFSHNCGNNTSFTQAPSSSGKYTLIIRPGNSNGFNDSSPSCSVVVTNKVPEPVTTLRCDKKAYNGSESIHFEWKPVYGAEEYWVYLWKDGVQLFSYNCGSNTSFTQAPSSSGKYTLYIRPGNINGFNDSSTPCRFVVGIYNITYNANGGTQAPSVQTKIYGSSITLSSTIPTREGYNFLGWSTSSTATTPTYSAGGSFTANQNTLLYAVWEKSHTHSWVAASCTAPKTCSSCGETEGSALGHTWTAATCTAPKTCTVCQATEGNALGHTWQNASCTLPKTCTVCGESEGVALGHDYTGGVCSVCGRIQPGTEEGTLVKTYTTGNATFTIYQTGNNLYKVIISGTGAIPVWNGLSNYAASVRVIEIKEGLTSIPYGAYKDMPALEAVTLPSTLTTINGAAFQNCTKLKTINLDEGLTTIGYAAFMNTGLTEVTVPDSVTTMGKWVFANCKSLTSVTFGASKLAGKTIPARTFSGCTALQTVDFGSKLRLIDDYAFNQCGLVNLTLPANIKSVDNAAFYKNQSLKSIKIEDGGATYLGWAAFYGCSALEWMNLGDSLTSVSTWVFTSCSSLTKVSLPNTITNIGRCTFKWCNNLETVKLPNGLTAITDELFASCTKLQNVILPSGLTAIGAKAFYRCKALTELAYGAEVTVAANAFLASGIR